MHARRGSTQDKLYILHACVVERDIYIYNICDLTGEIDIYVEACLAQVLRVDVDTTTTSSWSWGFSRAAGKREYVLVDRSVCMF
jgi:hypothetical protein